MFEARRKEVLDQIGNSIAIILTAPERQRNSDVHYPCRPDSDFYYLTHFPEPQAVAVLAPNHKDGEYILFCREKNPAQEQWEGIRAGLDGAVANYGANIAYPIDEIDEIMPRLLENREKIHCCFGRYAEFDSNVIKWMNQARSKIRSGIPTPTALEDLSRSIHKLRLIKQEPEHPFLQHAANTSVHAHKQAMKACRPGMKEYQIQAQIEYCFKENQCDSAYPSIVASGANACILHYIDNAMTLEDGDLLLIDAGAEYDCYAADITRTFPVNGKFSAEQKLIYEVVLEAQKKAIEAAIPGNRYSDVDRAATQTLVEGLIELKILNKTVEESLETKAYRPYYMHKIGHWLGLDVHDVGEYYDDGGSRLLEPGIYMTIEPGLYLSPSDDLDPKWNNIGIRIEDDVLITEFGHEITTAGVPKEIKDIEHWMAS